MNLKNISLVAILSFVTVSLTAQNFVVPNHTFSHKKTAYITLKSGNEVEGTVKKISRKKGLIEEIMIVSESGKKVKYDPADIQHMYLPPSGFDKLSNALEYMDDATMWSNSDLNADIINKGYAYFEQAEVMVKKKKMTLLMQLLNPSFSGKVQVYHDPFANETASVGIGGIKMAGGDDKSYYVKKGDEVAIRLKKKDYDEHYERLFGDCAEVGAKEKIKWSEFQATVYAYDKECE